MRELAISGADADQQQSPDFCPIQDSSEQTSCAECKDFKTHREVNALMVIFLYFFLLIHVEKKTITPHTFYSNMFFLYARINKIYYSYAWLY